MGFREVHWTDKTHRYSLLNDFICKTCKYDGYMESKERDKSGSRASSLPIAWKRSRFALINAGYRKVYDENDWPNGSGGSDKWITWVKLRDIKTNDQFYVLNTHTVASVESKGKPSGSRITAYKKHMDALTSRIWTSGKNRNQSLF